MTNIFMTLITSTDIKILFLVLWSEWFSAYFYFKNFRDQQAFYYFNRVLIRIHTQHISIEYVSIATVKPKKVECRFFEILANSK